MSMISELFAYETIPSLMTVVGGASIVLGLLNNRICGQDDQNCNTILSNGKTIGIVLAIGGILLGLLAVLGVMSFGPGYGFGMFGGGGGYGGYGGYW